jgi:hypothetical protein
MISSTDILSPKADLYSLTSGTSPPLKAICSDSNIVNRHFLHDPDTYHDPYTFKPERFLSCEGREPERDPEFAVFGFGRRKCSGRVLADTLIYLTISQSLAVFNMNKVVENGKEIEPVVQIVPGTINYPAPFKISFKLRSPEKEALIRSVVVEHPWEEGDSKLLSV